MEIYLILILVFITFTLVTYGILQYVARKNSSVTKRLKNVESSYENVDFEKDLRHRDASIKTKIDLNIEKLGSKFSTSDKTQEKVSQSKLKRTLIQAGYYRENSLRIFAGIKTLSTILFFVLAAVIAYMGKPASGVILICAAMSLLGYSLPNFILSIKARKRQEEIATGLPDALDFLVICVEAGLGLNAAIIRVGQELGLRCKSLSEELLKANQEMRTGISREQALHNLGDRNRSRDLKILAKAIVLSDRLGTNIADTLRAQSDSYRTRVRQRAEEKAAKAGIKMLFPLVLFILPALFIVILGPGILLVMDTLLPLIQK
jgi:tight adherence protein C